MLRIRAWFMALIVCIGGFNSIEAVGSPSGRLKEVGRKFGRRLDVYLLQLILE